jgi:iron complex transport system substrate-binding protein
MQHRIVTLMASATEIVCELGYESALVGRSHECDFPPSVAHLPVCSRPRIDVAASSREIDTQVRRSLQSALSIYEVLTGPLERVQPTLIVTQTQCEVCAVSLHDVQKALCETVRSQPRIVPLEAGDLAGLWEDIRRVAEAIGDPDSGERTVRRLQSRLDEIRLRTERACAASGRPTVACIEWLDPLMIAGNWVPELVEIAGGTPILGTAGMHSPYREWEDLLAADPDVIAVMPCGFDVSRTERELHLLTERPHWHHLKAVRSGRVHVIDGNEYFNRSGPRLVDSCAILAARLHPELADFA